MITIAVIPLKDVQKVKEYIKEHDLISREYKVKHTDTHLYIPVKQQFSYKNIPFEEHEESTYSKKNKPVSLKKALEKQLSKEELKSLKTAFDSVGTIAIIEIDETLEKKEKLIADTLLEVTPGIETVVKKVGQHQGTFRTQAVEILSGEKTKETIHKENGVELALNVEEVYFSPRLSTERKRITQLVKTGEKILVMFSGCAPYVCVLAKNTNANHITGIEINPIGHEYGLKNIKKNKIKNATLINGDVKKILPTLDETFDRILMPLPKSAEDFLDVALEVAKKGTIIHFYAFLNEDEFDIAHNHIKKACEQAKVKYKTIDTIKCGQHAPYVFRICVDFEIVEK